MPLALRLLLAMLVGAVLGGFVNWACYRLAWNRRSFTPWGPKPEGAEPRSAADRIPILGWWRLRREESLSGKGFWIRPMLVEVLMAVGVAALYWWEIDRLGLIRGQWPALPQGVVPPANVLATFIGHVLLLTLMAAASLIDIDERLIPDEITTPGTLLGLTLAMLMPNSLLPDVSPRLPANALGPQLEAPVGDQAGRYLERTTLVAPLPLADDLYGDLGLKIGLACWIIWNLSVAHWIWYGRRRASLAFRVVCRQLVRYYRRPLPSVLLLAGLAAIVAVHRVGGTAWAGLLTALVGMIGSGAVVWVVRVVASSALGKEAMGFGDVTLMMMVGTFIGWQAGVVVFFLAPFAALIVGVLQLIIQRDDAIPYGPFLCLGVGFVVVRWADVWLSVQVFFAVWWLVPLVLAITFPVLGLMLLVWRGIKSLRGPDGEPEA
ncbi:MAG: A24 family peptidase [Planctomycetota bacterium]